MSEKENFNSQNLFENLCSTFNIFDELKNEFDENDKVKINTLLKFCEQHKLLKRELLTTLDTTFSDQLDTLDINNINQLKKLKTNLLETLFTIIKKRATEKNLLSQVNEILGIKIKTAEELKQELEPKLEHNEHFIKYFLLFNSSHIDQGNNAHIFKLNITNFNELSPSILLKLKEENLLDSEEYSNILLNSTDVNYEWITKLLKLGMRSNIEYEFNMQKTIYNIFNTQINPSLSYTSIAKPRGFYTLELIPEIKTFLKLKGFTEIDNLHELHFLIIDYAPGKDFARTLYETIINEKYNQNIPFDMPFSTLQKEVAEILNIKMLISDDIKKLSEFKEKLYEKAINFLAQQGYRLDPRIKPLLQRSINLLHKNGITLNDAHLRNFIINGNIWIPKNLEQNDIDITQLAEFKIWLIDFGRAEQSPNAINYSDYSPRDGYMNDFYIIDRLKSLLT